MISSISGKVTSKAISSIVVEVGGVGIFAIVLGRRGEAIKASLIAQRDKPGAKNP